MERTGAVVIGSAAGEASPGSGGPVVITVHGTNDADKGIEGRRWWQLGSNFCRGLTSALAQRGIEGVSVVPLQWSGANSDFDRLNAANALAKLAQRIDASGRPFAIIGHSHGGNVVMEAIAQMRSAQRLGSVVTFGTPFFTRQMKSVPRLIALFQCLLGATMVPIMIWYLATLSGAEIGMKAELSILLLSICGAGAWAFWSGWRKLRHRKRALKRFSAMIDAPRWLTIHSPRDEAMRLLETAAIISPRYVTTASATRALNAFAALAGVVVTATLFIWNWRYFFDPISTKISAGQFGLGTAADLTFLPLVPIVYGIVLVLVRAVARFGGGWLYGRILSQAIHGGVIGAAFGGDGPYKLTAVTRLPPYLPGALENRIEALHLGGIDDAAVFQAARQLYDGVVSNDAPEGGIGDPDLMWKRLSDSLYHNAYMRDDEVVASVADHLASGWKKTP